MGVQCARPDCDQLAVAKLAADFNERQGWLRDESAADTAHDYRLCARHADRLVLPVNWVLHDERSRRSAGPPEPAGQPGPASSAGPDRRVAFDPAASVDESTPLLSRAFRAAAPATTEEPPAVQ